MGPEAQIFVGKTLDDAVRKGLEELGLSRAEVMITVVEEGSSGFLGLGSRPYKVRMRARPGGAIHEPEAERESDRRRRGGRDRDRGGRDRDRGRGRRGDERRPGTARHEGESRPASGRTDDGRGERRGPSDRGRGPRERIEARGSRDDRPRSEDRPRDDRARDDRPRAEERSGGRGNDRRGRRSERGPREEQPREAPVEARELTRAMPEDDALTPDAAVSQAEGEVGGGDRPRRRRGRRGGRRRRREGEGLAPAALDAGVAVSDEALEVDGDEGVEAFEPAAVAESREPSGPPARAENEPREFDRDRPRRDRDRDRPRRDRGDEGPGLTPEQLAAEGTRWTENLLRAMGFEAKVAATAEDTRVDVTAVVQSDDDLLTGPKGEVRQALQHLLNRMVNRGEGSRYHLQLEINDFWKRREGELVELARALADESLRASNEVVTEYLNAQERRIIHVTLKEDTRVKTYALGTGLIKRVAIAPADFPERPGED